MQAIRPSEIVRYVMRKHGKTVIFTNKYATCRTVKCYQSGHHKSDKKMTKNIMKELNFFDIDATIKYKVNNEKSTLGNSIIVTLPL